GRGRGTQIHVQSLSCSSSRWIAIPVAAVVGASPSNILALRRLRELPHLSEIHPALHRIWRILRKRTSGRRRTSVVDRPKCDLTRARVLANVFRSHNVLLVGRPHARTIN